MIWCIELAKGHWAFLLLLTGLTGLLLVGMAGVGLAERRAAHKQRRMIGARGAIRVVPRADRPAANEEDGR